MGYGKTSPIVFEQLIILKNGVDAVRYTYGRIGCQHSYLE